MKKHPLLSAVVAVVVLLLIAIAIVPLFINANTFRGTLETQLTAALGRKVTLGNLSFSLFTGSLVADNVAIADDRAFSPKPFLQAQSLHIGVEVGPLLLHRQLLVTSFVADTPTINLVHNSQGVWNFSDMGKSAGSRTPETKSESALPNFTVGTIKIVNGTATVSDLPLTGAPFTYSNLNLSVQNFSFAKYFPFTLTAALPAGGTVNVQGTAGPINAADASDTPLNITLGLKHFDPVAAGVLEASQGISMLADIDAKATSNGQTLKSDGTVRADRLRLVANGSPTPSPVDIAYTITHQLEARTGQIEELAIKTGSVAVHVTGTYAMPAHGATLALHVSAPNLPINQVEALLPAAGVRLPSGSSLQGGTLTANLGVSGLAAAPTISGPVQVDNTRLAGFDLGSKIGGLKPASGTQGGTQIQQARADVTSSPSGTRIDNLYAAVPQLGTATGAGTISPQGALNFSVIAKINSNSGALAGLSAVGGVLGQAVNSAAADGIPVHITGTTTNPVIQADINKLLQKNAGNLLKQQLLGNSNGNNANKPDPSQLLNKLFHH